LRTAITLIAISTATNRPANATPECGVGWLAWGGDVQVSALIRRLYRVRKSGAGQQLRIDQR